MNEESINNEQKAYEDFTNLKLGNVSYADMTVTKSDEDLIRDVNQIYLNSQNDINSDKMQLEYDPDSKMIKFGIVKTQVINDKDDGNFELKQIYVPTNESGTVTPDPDPDPTPDPDPDPTDVTTVDSPDYYALLDLLEVLEVHYEDEPISALDFVDESSGTITSRNSVTGIRFRYVSSESVSINCIRIKNNNLNPSYNKKFYLKVIRSAEKIIGDIDETYDYGEIDDHITTVSSNCINQKDNDDEWFEWYFPKNVILENDYIYVIIPHHDKTYEKVTESDARIALRTSSDINSGSKGIDGVWTNTRSETIGIQASPVIQFCYKNPTTVIMTQ